MIAQSRRLAVAVVLALPALAACGGPTATVTVTATQSAPVSTVIQTASATTPAVPRPQTAVPSSAAETTAPQSWSMPDLTGIVLQDAQDAIQSLTDNELWYTDSVDATGGDRSQINDSNWVVCSQIPAAGEIITADSHIVFRVVKIDETCP